MCDAFLRSALLLRRWQHLSVQSPHYEGQCNTWNDVPVASLMGWEKLGPSFTELPEIQNRQVKDDIIDR